MPQQLTEKQKRFAEGIVKGLTQEQAYVQAGYKCRGATARSRASHMATYSNVQAYISELRSEAVKDTISTAQRVHAVMLEIMEGNLKTDALLVQKTGELVYAPPRADARIKAGELLLKMASGVYDPRGNDDNDGQLDAVAQALADVSDD